MTAELEDKLAIMVINLAQLLPAVAHQERLILLTALCDYALMVGHLGGVSESRAAVETQFAIQTARQH